MHRLFRAPILLLTLFLCTAASAENAAYVGRHESNPRDVEAIMTLTKDFRSALSDKNVKRLSELVLNSNILFASPGTNYDGVPSGGYERFAQFVSSARVPIEQKFHSIQITQDGHLAWVSFDFEFLQDAKVVNYGFETWQVLKTAGDRWKILSVVWTSHGPPPPQ